MMFQVFGCECHFDLSKKGEPWDMAVLIQHADPGEDGEEPTVKNRVVPYRVPFGVLRPESPVRGILHFIFLRLMVSFYGRVRKETSKDAG